MINDTNFMSIWNTNKHELLLYTNCELTNLWLTLFSMLSQVIKVMLPLGWNKIMKTLKCMHGFHSYLLSQTPCLLCSWKTMTFISFYRCYVIFGNQVCKLFYFYLNLIMLWNLLCKTSHLESFFIYCVVVNWNVTFSQGRIWGCIHLPSILHDIPKL